MAKTSRNFVGLYLGGLADEIDAAVVKVSGEGDAMSLRQTHCLQRPLPAALAAPRRPKQSALVGGAGVCRR